jgi:hypothetical protein
MDTLLAGTCPPLEGFIVPVLCPALLCLWKSFRTHRENHSGLLRKTVRLPAGITCSPSARNPFTFPRNSHAKGFLVISISSVALSRFPQARFGNWDKNDPKMRK